MTASAGNWATSPNNWANSSNNWANSSNNWANNPNNWANNPNNFNRQNGIYDSSGNSAGYYTTNPSGFVNIYDNTGTRMGFGR
jgi:hypothetical protein